MATAKTSTDVTSDSDVQEPHTVVVMQQLLESMGLERYEPRVVNQMVDFMYRYITDVLLDAETYAEHAGKAAGQVDLADVMLAMQARSAFTFAAPPDLDEVAAMAEVVNDKQLPKYPTTKTGLLLPEDKDCLTAPNYAITPPDS